MAPVLRNSVYARLLGAQVIALVGTGLLTVALGLLAFDVAGGDAGTVLGTAMAIKMVAYVGVSPVTTALAARLPRRPVLVAADLVRAGIALLLPAVSQPWQIYVLVLVLQSASATFTPTFQAVIPSVLPDEEDYTQALSLSRLAYDLESLLSPVLAAALLTLISYHHLFVGTVGGFLASAALVATCSLPHTAAPPPTRFRDRLTQGTRVFWTSPELRGLMGLNLVIATTTAMVVVNTVVLVQADLGRPQADVAVLLAANGGGSMVVALSVPRLLGRWPDRQVMLAGGTALPLLLLAATGVITWAGGTPQWVLLLALWTLLGAASSLVLTPSARLLRRNSSEEDRSAVFAAQFSWSHACFLATYPLAGLLGAASGLPTAALVLVALGTLGVAGAARAWPAPGQHGTGSPPPRHDHALYLTQGPCPCRGA